MILFKYFFLKNFKKKKNNFFLKIPSKKLYFTCLVNISDIKFFLQSKDIVSKDFFLLKGSWDKKKLSIQKYKKYNVNYRSVFQIFEQKKNFSKCDEFIEKSKIILSGNKTNRGHKSLEELKEYFRSLKKVKHSLKKKGYLSQIQLKNKSKNDEIGVVIGPNGEIIKLEDKFGGTHRFALCKILKIKKVIISVKAIHFDFLKQYIKQLRNHYENKKLIEIVQKKLRKQYPIN